MANPIYVTQKGSGPSAWQPVNTAINPQQLPWSLIFSSTSTSQNRALMPRPNRSSREASKWWMQRGLTGGLSARGSRSPASRSVSRPTCL
jgi:hypothetical protein